ncbi:MAG TPA: radical SAM protein [Chitinispirillaceae bacterium]|nr:radical SAM protein [Chitinispirillaceae bacterium]
MKIVLFHPRGYEYVPGKKVINSVACVMPPIGLASIAAVLEKAGHSVTIVDAALESNLSNDVLTEIIVGQKPDFVGFSAVTVAFMDAYDVCIKIKEKASSIKTVFGGVHASWGKGELLKKFGAIDYIVAGEGEFALLSIVEGKELPETVYYRDGSEVVQGTTPLQPCVMDDLPFPAYHLLKGFPKRYLMPLFGYPKHPGANIISSRGCVYKCSYCDRSVFGKSFRWNSPEYTFRQVQMLHSDFGIRHINFYDDLFTLNRSRVETLCNMLHTSKMPVTFNCIVRVGHIDPELIKILKWGGCWMVSVGVESGDQAILDSHKEGLSLEVIRRDVELLHKSKLWVKGLFMIGFPGETEEAIVKTRKFACSLPLKDANLTAFTPFPGAPISKEINTFGKCDNDWSKMDCVNFVFKPDTVESRELLEHHYKLFFREFYNRSFMRRKVYPAMLLQSPHSIVRLFRHAYNFLSYLRSLS